MPQFNHEIYISNLSIDCVIFGFQNKELKVLVSNPKYVPEYWALPGGYIKKSESVESAASRILFDRTNLENVFLEQFRVFGSENRIIGNELREKIKSGFLSLPNNRFDKESVEWLTERFVSIGFYALVNINQFKPQLGEFDLSFEWKSLNDLPKLIYDHYHIVQNALEALRQNLDQKLIGFNLLPETFIMKDLQQLYEAVYDKPFPMNNFQKKILSLDILERLEKKFTGAQHTAPYLYRFKS